MPKFFQGDISKDVISGVLITSLIFYAAAYIPFIGFFCTLFIPVTILFYRSKLGRKSGAIILAVTAVFMVIVLGEFTIELSFFLELLLLGFILSELFELNISVEKTIFCAWAAVFFSWLVGLFFYSNFVNAGMEALITDYVGKNLELTIALYEKMDVPEKNIQMLVGSLETIKYVLVRIIPSLVAVSILFFAWTSLLCAKPILKKKNLFYPDFGRLNHWKAPEVIVWGVIGCGIMLIMPTNFIKVAGLNGMFILMTIYFFQGIAIVSYFFEKKQFPILLKILLYSFIALQFFVLFFIIGLGLFDTWLNFRKLGDENS